MNLTDFCKTYPDEESCERALREYRECNTLYCPVCGGLHLSWNPSHRSWTCTDCGHETTLRSGTVMQGGKLPVFDWFVAMFLIAGTKRAISALEVQRQLGRKRYQP
ncbi:IS1595 family transposase, partial [Prevotella denticola]|nr:IS1595 family transposase [Prevotella denticola]